MSAHAPLRALLPLLTQKPDMVHRSGAQASFILKGAGAVDLEFWLSDPGQSS